MLTTHGVHEWQVVPGLVDTGGQNVFVNQFTEELAHQGFKITIANRGGYPHPVTKIPQTGVFYKDKFQRILYLEDGLEKFIRKEDMGSQIGSLANGLARYLIREKQKVDLIISHYWDAALVGEMFLKETGLQAPHVWVPHSLGAIKKRNVSKNQWLPLRIDERIEHERKILAELSYVATTSPAISESLTQDYNYDQPPLWLPPCVSTERFHPHPVPDDAAAWAVLSEASGLPIDQIRKRKIITEISRTDTTKRKDILLKAFAQVVQERPDTLLILTIDRKKEPLGPELMALIQNLGIRSNVAVLGSVWDLLPDIYAVTDIYCTPSIMEGFGMAAQEAAATSVPVVASSLVPFATQYLYGATEGEVKVNDSQPVSIGQGAIIVQPDHTAGFAQALITLLSDKQLRLSMGKKAYTTTVPQFTWPRTVEKFIQDLNKPHER
ncbi:MAG: glycosyltransferase [Anaerolineales bacterium]